jgi:hypothetical protein
VPTCACVCPTVCLSHGPQLRFVGVTLCTRVGTTTTANALSVDFLTAARVNDCVHVVVCPFDHSLSIYVCVRCCASAGCLHSRRLAWPRLASHTSPQLSSAHHILRCLTSPHVMSPALHCTALDLSATHISPHLFTFARSSPQAAGATDGHTHHGGLSPLRPPSSRGADQRLIASSPRHKRRRPAGDAEGERAGTQLLSQFFMQCALARTYNRTATTNTYARTQTNTHTHTHTHTPPFAVASEGRPTQRSKKALKQSLPLVRFTEADVDEDEGQGEPPRTADASRDAVRTATPWSRTILVTTH